MSFCCCVLKMWELTGRIRLKTISILLKLVRGVLIVWMILPRRYEPLARRRQRQVEDECYKNGNGSHLQRRSATCKAGAAAAAPTVAGIVPRWLPEASWTRKMKISSTDHGTYVCVTAWSMVMRWRRLRRGRSIISGHRSVPSGGSRAGSGQLESRSGPRALSNLTCLFTVANFPVNVNHTEGHGGKRWCAGVPQAPRCTICVVEEGHGAIARTRLFRKIRRFSGTFYPRNFSIFSRHGGQVLQVLHWTCRLGTFADLITD